MLSFLEAVIGEVLAGSRLRECGRAGTPAPRSPRPRGERAVSPLQPSFGPARSSRSGVFVPLGTGRASEVQTLLRPESLARALRWANGQVELEGPGQCWH